MSTPGLSTNILNSNIYIYQEENSQQASGRVDGVFYHAAAAYGHNVQK